MAQLEQKKNTVELVIIIKLASFVNKQNFTEKLLNYICLVFVLLRPTKPVYEDLIIKSSCSATFAQCIN